MPLINILYKALTGWVLLASSFSLVSADNPSIERSEIFGSGGSSYDTLGSTWRNIKRIKRIQAWNGSFQFHSVIKEIQVDYETFDGGSEQANFGSRGLSNGKPLDYTFKDGEYISSVDLRRGNFFDWIAFSTNLGYTSGRRGSNTDRSPNKIFRAGGGAIIGFRGGAASVVDSIGVITRFDQAFSRTIVTAPDYDIPDFLQGGDPRNLVDSSDSCGSAAVFIPNMFGVDTIKQEVSCSQEVSESETVVYGEESEISTSTTVGVSATASTEASIGVASAGASSTASVEATVGASFTSSVETGETVTRTVTRQQSTTFAARPGTELNARIVYSEAPYSIPWTAEADVYYETNPLVAVRETVSGTLEGTAASTAYIIVEVSCLEEALPTCDDGNLPPRSGACYHRGGLNFLRCAEDASSCESATEFFRTAEPKPVHTNRNPKTPAFGSRLHLSRFDHPQNPRLQQRQMGGLRVAFLGC